MARYTTPNTVIQVNINGSLTNIDGIESASGPTGQKQEIDMTALADTAAVNADGFPDYGEVTFNCFDNPGQAGNAYLLTRFGGTNQTDHFKVILPFSGTGNTIQFNGYVKTWSLDLQKNAGAKFTSSVRLTGALSRT